MQAHYGAQSSSYPVVASALSQPVNWSGRGDGYLPRSHAQVKNRWSYSFTLPYIFMTWCLNKEKGEFCISFGKQENRIPPGILLTLRCISLCSTYRTRGINAVYTSSLSRPSQIPYLCYTENFSLLTAVRYSVIKLYRQCEY
jgi:hypothetical protein